MTKPESAEENRSKKLHARILRRLTMPLAETVTHVLRTRIDDLEHTIHTTQLEVNHNQHFLLEEIDKKVKNSGTLVLSEREMITKIFSGLKLYLDPRDVAISPHLALDGIWEHRITIAWLGLLHQDMTVLDIGSNNGYYGALAAQHTNKKTSEIVMFEANPHLIPYIQKSIDVNFLGQHTTLENLAVADKPGTITLNVLKDYVGSSSVYSDDQVKTYMPNKWKVETEEAIKVKAVTIDDYCKDHDITAVDLMIMDIEGFEDKAYEGMRATVKRSPNATLFIEFTRAAYKDPEGFYNQMLEDFGHVYTIDDEGYLIKPSKTSFGAIIGDAEDWVMPVFSKRADLNSR